MVAIRSRSSRIYFYTGYFMSFFCSTNEFGIFCFPFPSLFVLLILLCCGFRSPAQHFTSIIFGEGPFCVVSESATRLTSFDRRSMLRQTSNTASSYAYVLITSINTWCHIPGTWYHVYGGIGMAYHSVPQCKYRLTTIDISIQC